MCLSTDPACKFHYRAGIRFEVPAMDGLMMGNAIPEVQKALQDGFYVTTDLVNMVCLDVRGTRRPALPVSTGR